MRALLLTVALGLTLASAGCSVRACRAGTLFVSLDASAAGGHGDQLVVAVTVDGQTLTATRSYEATERGTLEVTFPSYPAGKAISVDVTVLAGGVAIADGNTSLTAAAGCSAASVTLSSLAGNDLSSLGGDDLGAGGDMGCSGLQCQIVHCDGGVTTLSGVIYTPAAAGANPVYNAVAYVPNGPLAALPKGTTCDTCVSHVDNAVAAAITDGLGRFTINNVPSGDNIPIVVQAGRWRRKAILSHVEACTNNVVPPDASRLPRNAVEGELPHIAVVTGNLDGLECVLRKMGIDDSEFTSSTGSGSVHLYVGNGATLPAAANQSALLESSTQMLNYDVILLDCAGMAQTRTAAAKSAMIDYLDSGGRVLATHYNYDLFYQNGAFSSVATWNVDQSTKPASPVNATVDTSSPRSSSLNNWLLQIGATTTSGSIGITMANHDVDNVSVTAATRFVSTMTPTTTQLFTVATPIGVPATNQCGQLAFLDFHVIPASSTTGMTFPAECATTALTPQERLVEYALLSVGGVCIKPPSPH